MAVSPSPGPTAITPPIEAPAALVAPSEPPAAAPAAPVQAEQGTGRAQGSGDVSTPASGEKPSPRRSQRDEKRSPDVSSSKHDGFEACHGAPDVEACDEELEGLADREGETCSEKGERSPACLEARRDYEAAAVCANEPNRQACESELRENPCFVDPGSSACVSFLDVPTVQRCRAEDPASFECEVVTAALGIHCLGIVNPSKALCPQAGGGSEELTGPRGAGRATRIGLLTDPGASGDDELAQVSTGDDRPSSNRTASGAASRRPGGTRYRWRSSGPCSWPRAYSRGEEPRRSANRAPPPPAPSWPQVRPAT